MMERRTLIILELKLSDCIPNYQKFGMGLSARHRKLQYSLIKLHNQQSVFNSIKEHFLSYNDKSG
jgi:hypothetical protein